MAAGWVRQVSNSSIKRATRGRNAFDLARRQAEIHGLKVSGTVAARMDHIPARPTTKRDASGGSVCSSRYARSVAAGDVTHVR